jgi:hypothetical protein
MAGATNTIIQILRSEETAYPTSLNPGEQAYSYVSQKLFIGNAADEPITIGGEYYVDLIDGATADSTGNTIVRRDDAGNVSFKMVRLDDKASQDTDAVNKGYLDDRINALSSNTIYEGTLGEDGYSNVHTELYFVDVVANNATVARFTENTARIWADNTYITGNLTVAGTQTVTNVETLYVENNEIVLNANTEGSAVVDAYITVNRGDGDNAAIVWSEASGRWLIDSATGTNYAVVDVGGGQSIAGTTTLNQASVTNGLHTGTLEVSGSSYVEDLTANGTITTDQLVVAANVQLANVANVAYYSNISEITYEATYKHYLLMSDELTGNNRIQSNSLMYFDTTNTTFGVGYTTYTALPNTMFQATGSSIAYVQNNLQNLDGDGSGDLVVTADNGSDTDTFIDLGIAGSSYGTYDLISTNDGYLLMQGDSNSGDNSHGNLFIMTASTGANTIGDIVFSIGYGNEEDDAANAAGYIHRENNTRDGTLTWAIGAGKYLNANSAYTLDVAGAANVASLYINDTQVLGESFALPVAFGGTGLQTVTANSVLYGNGTGAFGVTAAPTAGQVLQYRTDGVVFGGLDGGTF